MIGDRLLALVYSTEKITPSAPSPTHRNKGVNWLIIQPLQHGLAYMPHWRANSVWTMIEVDNFFCSNFDSFTSPSLNSILFRFVVQIRDARIDIELYSMNWFTALYLPSNIYHCPLIDQALYLPSNPWIAETVYSVQAMTSEAGSRMPKLEMGTTSLELPSTLIIVFCYDKYQST